VVDVVHPRDMVQAMMGGRGWTIIRTPRETESGFQPMPEVDGRSSGEVAKDDVSYVELMEWIRPAPRS
jgi:hypothetical protein